MAGARVHTIESLREAKAALAEFAQAAEAVLGSVESDIGRTAHWLREERPAYWKAEVRRRTDAVERARLAIERKRLARAPEPASVVEERKALDRAVARLHDAVERQATTRRWAVTFEREAGLAQAACRPLGDALVSCLPAALARLERMMLSLEEYRRVAPPTTDDEPPPDETGGPA